MSSVYWLMSVQAILGAVDNFWHHEVTENLGVKRAAATELALHAGREFIYSILFFALAWWRWQGFYALLVAALLIVEVLITLCDFVVEDRTRRLPAFERVLHTVLALNYGATLGMLLPLLWTQWQLPNALNVQTHGAFTGLFTVFAVGVLAWSLRNARAALRLSGPPEWVSRPIRNTAPRTGRMVLVSGATGFVGGHLVRRLIRRGDQVIVLARNRANALHRFGPHVDIIGTPDDIADDQPIDAIVNLAGEPILSMPWTRRRRAALLASRIDTTRALVGLAARLTIPAKVLINASAIGYYGVHADEDIDEHCGPATGFQSDLCQQWEAAALGAQGLVARIVRVRIGLVLGNDGGALPRMSLPHRVALGAVLGSGRQWVSWIHIEDLVGLIEFAIDKPTVRGVLNGVAPGPVTQETLQRAIAATLQRPLRLKAPAGLVRLLLGEMAELLVDGQRVFPNRPVALGYRYRYAHLERALKDLLAPTQNALESSCANVYFNGDCPVCSFEMSRYARLGGVDATKLTYVDAMQHPTALAGYGLRQEHLQRRVYVSDARGRLLSGIPALIVIWSRLPGYRVMARIVNLPGVRALAEFLYDRMLAPALAAWALSRRNSGARVTATRRP